jgi:hypothetical protein
MNTTKHGQVNPGAVKQCGNMPILDGSRAVSYNRSHWISRLNGARREAAFDRREKRP